MKKVELFLVKAWAIACLVFAMVLSIKALQGGRAEQVPSNIVFLFIGLLGVYVGSVLSRMNERFVRVESEIAELRRSK